MRALSLENPQARWFLMVLAPLGVGWVAAFGTAGPVGLAPVAAVGVIAVAGAIGLGLLLWRLTMRSAVASDGTGMRLGGLVSAIVLSTVGWVWLLYALNPFRVLSIVDAMSVSRSFPWQLVAGTCMFSGFVVAAQMVRLRERIQSMSVARVAESTPLLDHLAIRIGPRTVLVALDSVERLQGCDDHVAVVTRGKRILASYRLREIEQRLDASKFVRIHRSHIVNVAFIERVERLDANRDVVVMKTGERVTASRAGSVVLRRLLWHRPD
jgi:LytTr DNA-binding domain-containing protein